MSAGLSMALMPAWGWQSVFFVAVVPLPGLIGAAAILVFLWQRPVIAAQAKVALEKPLS